MECFGLPAESGDPPGLLKRSVEATPPHDSDPRPAGGLRCPFMSPCCGDPVPPGDGARTRQRCSAPSSQGRHRPEKTRRPVSSTAAGQRVRNSGRRHPGEDFGGPLFAVQLRVRRRIDAPQHTAAEATKEQ
jgi:hypothetical protein